MEATKDIKRPVLSYFGGKWRIAPWVIAHFPQHKIYTEPFGGAASVLLRKPASKVEVYNDLRKTIVNFFKVLRDKEKAQELKRRIELTPFSRVELNEAIDFDEEKDPIEMARKLIVISFVGFHCDIVSGRKKAPAFNSYSFSTHNLTNSWSNYPEIIPKVAERLKRVIIENMDALEVVKKYDSTETLHYLDPPYYFSTRKSSKNYEFEMADSKHEKLIELLRSGSLKGMVVLSGYQNKLYDSLGWRIEKKKTHNLLNQKREECIYICPKTCKALSGKGTR
jgi:DNA adenine methylase